MRHLIRVRTDELINNLDVDVVVLCTHAASRLILGKQCLEAGKHGMQLIVRSCKRRIFGERVGLYNPISD